MPTRADESDDWSQALKMKTSDEVPRDFPESERGRRRFRFGIKHLMWITACVAISISALKVVTEAVGYVNTTVEIIRYHPTGTVEFLIHLPDGFAQSGVSVPANTPSVDYSKLIGATYNVRYRARRVLWLPPQEPVMEAIRLIESEVHRFANEEQAN